MKIYAVIMAGGGGTRFWPLSRQSTPKQLLDLSGRGTLISETARRIAGVIPPENIFIVTGEDQMAGMVSEAKKTGLVQAGHILSEPCGRNTSACIGYAAMELVKKYGDGIMCVFPSDSVVKDEEAFCLAIKTACGVAWDFDCAVTLGIEPTYAATGYGYIRYDRSKEDSSYRVLEFHEKPDAATAMEYIKSGDYVWNSGIFVWKASVILQLLEKLLPEVYKPLYRIGEAMGTPDEKRAIAEIYPTIPSVSIDYGVMEKAKDVRVIPVDMGWSDVGSWESMGEIYDKDDRGNIFIGDHLAIDTTDCVTYSKKRLITTIGVSGLVIVETEDAILICDKDRAQDVRLAVEELKKMGRSDLL